MNERDENGTALRELLMDAEVIAWLEDYKPPRLDEDEDDDAPAAA